MYKSFLFRMAVIALFTGFLSIDTSAQHYGGAAVRHINMQLRDAFEQLNSDDPSINSFYDMAGHFTDSSMWSNNSSDTL